MWSIELSQSYLPAELRDEITIKSREHYALCALNDALFFLERGHDAVALKHVQGAFQLSTTPETVYEFVRLLKHSSAGSLRELLPHLFSRLQVVPKSKGDGAGSRP